MVSVRRRKPGPSSLAPCCSEVVVRTRIGRLLRRKPIYLLILVVFLLLVLINEMVWLYTIHSSIPKQQETTSDNNNNNNNVSPLDHHSVQLQEQASLEAQKAIAQRGNDDACHTTLNRTALPAGERGFLLFCAPPPLTSTLPSSMQSWKDALQGKGTLVVLTQDSQTRQVCAQHNIPVVCTEHSDEGLPLLNRMLQRMHQSHHPNSGIVAYVNSDISIHDNPTTDISRFVDFLQSLHQLPVWKTPSQVYQAFVQPQSGSRTTDDWFAVLTRTDVDANGQNPIRHQRGGYDFWAWNTGPTTKPLLPFDIPPFRFPLASYDMWLLDMMIQSSERAAIDATLALETFHKAHARKSDNWYKILQTGVTGVFLNSYFAYREPRTSLAEDSVASPDYKYLHHVKMFGRPAECPYQVVREEATGALTLSKRTYWSNLAQDKLVETGCIENEKCAERVEIERLRKRAEYIVSYLPYSGASLFARLFQKIEAAAADHWRYTLEEQLRTHANKDGFVLLTAVNYGYREHLLNFKCTLERVGMRDNFVVAAMDEKIYEWGLLRGFPIYLAGSARGRSVAEGSAFGGQGFRSVTKLKSVAVLEVLNAGYSVIWSDVDITWFQHPFDALAGFMKPDGGIAIQSNAPYISNPDTPAIPHDTVGAIEYSNDDPAARRRLNSGLYVAPNNPLVRSAFQEIVRHAASSRQSEQPSFDEILCAKPPSERGYSSCVYRPHPSIWRQFFGDSTLQESDSKAMHVETLDRFQFPNGAILLGSGNDNVYALGRDEFSQATGKELYAAHNNWISSETEKKARQKASGWWFARGETGCRYAGESA